MILNQSEYLKVYSVIPEQSVVDLLFATHPVEFKNIKSKWIFSVFGRLFTFEPKYTNTKLSLRRLSTRLSLTNEIKPGVCTKSR